MSDTTTRGDRDIMTSVTALGARDVPLSDRQPVRYHMRCRVVYGDARDAHAPAIVQILEVCHDDRRQAYRLARAFMERTYPVEQGWSRARIEARRSRERTDLTLLRLGALYERLQATWHATRADDDYQAFHLCEQNIQALAAQMIAREEGEPEFVVVRGRNIIRRARGMEPLHV